MATATTTLTDEQIQRDVLDEVKWDARVQPNEIGVAVKDGVVTLTGWVDAFTKKWAAEEAAHRVQGGRQPHHDPAVSAAWRSPWPPGWSSRRRPAREAMPSLLALRTGR